MPITKSAKKALSVSIKKWKTKETILNLAKTELIKLHSLIDKLRKKNIFHKNKANRFKSRFAKKLNNCTLTT